MLKRGLSPPLFLQRCRYMDIISQSECEATSYIEVTEEKYRISFITIFRPLSQIKDIKKWSECRKVRFDEEISLERAIVCTVVPTNLPAQGGRERGGEEQHTLFQT